MEYRTLGRTGLKVSLFSLGAMNFGGSAGPFMKHGQLWGDDARRLVDVAIDAGINLIDTSDAYSYGESEEVLGEALMGRRDKVLVATKVFSPMGPGPNDVGTAPGRVIASCEASLRRIKTDYIDLYQLHNQDLLAAPEETLRALDDLVRAGKVRYIGSSNFSGWHKMKSLAASERLGIARYASQQIQYSLLWRDVENELLPLGVDQQVGALIWSPLAGGYLTGKFRRGAAQGQPTRMTEERLAGVDHERAERIFQVIDAIVAERPGVSPVQVALNWVVRRAGVTSVIVGARNPAQLLDNLAAGAWSLSDEEMGRLDAVSATAPRYPYYHHALYASERNPPLPLLPARV